MNELAKTESAALTADDLKTQAQAITEAMRKVMTVDVDYGRIPGAPKPSLLKPGAEKIMALFRIGGEYTVTRTTDGYDTEITVDARGFSITDGRTIGHGIGVASTSEKKYKWRAAVCDAEYEDTDPARRQISYIRKEGRIERVKQVRQNPADIINTVVKMAKKRAIVDLVLTATACSSIFTQDAEELPQIAENATESRTYREPMQRQSPAPYDASAPQDGGKTAVISDRQAKRLYAIGIQKGLSKEEMKALVLSHGEVADSRAIPVEFYDRVVAAFDSAEPGKVLA